MMNKKTLNMLMALMVALVMVMGGLLAATAETTAAAPETTAAVEEAPFDPAFVYVTVNGVDITAQDVSYIFNSMMNYYASMGYDVSSEEAQSEFFTYAIQSAVQNELVRQHMQELGIAATDEDKQTAQTSFETAVANYETSLLAEIENPTDEDKAKAHEETLKTAQDQGFTVEYIIDSNLLNKAYDAIMKDAVATDDDVKAHYAEIVASEKELYANDFANYEMMTMYAPYYGQAAPIYMPAGVRGVKHILLSVSDELKTAYQEAQAALEEALDETETTGESEATEEATEEPSNEGVKDIEAIKTEILASVKATVDEIMAKFNAGTSFDDLVAEYGTDAGMKQEPQLSQGYPLHLDSQRYDPAFKAAAFDQLQKIGDISAPVVGQSGVHILFYALDIPEGAPELTAETMESYRAEVLSEKQEAALTEKLAAWEAASTITYAE